MKFAGVLGFDGLVSSSLDHTAVPTSSSLDSEPSRQKGLFLKHGRPSAEPLEDWMSLKVARTEAMPATEAPKAAPFLFRSSSHPIFPGGEKMLSFSSEVPLSARPDSSMISNDGSLPYYLHHYHHPSWYSDLPSAASFYRNGGMISGSTNVNMHGVMTGVRGPFTPSQWIELEYQALIYKHINANVPIPASLLIPIRRGINTSGLSAYPPGPFRSNTLGWGSYHLGFYGNGDPEPGRCRRTDGKKWRCSRDAVADQKYCERHLNRGRHRSRKLVEGRSGQAMPVTASTQLASAGSAGTTSNGLNAMQQQTGGLQSNVSDTNPSQFDRAQMQKDNIHDLSLLTGASSKPANILFHESKHLNPFEGSSSRADFALGSADFLLKPPKNSFSENISFDSSSQHEDQNSRTNPLRHFIDDWPESQHNHPSMSWPELEEMKSDSTQLSISVHTDFFSSSSSSPNQEKMALSPLRLSREFNPVKNYTMGGPLGEVLNNTNATPKNYTSSSLNLLIDGWDSSPRLESSPSGVLQRTIFGSLSSSAGSSPRAENHKALDSTSNLCEDLIGPTLGNPMAVPLL